MDPYDLKQETSHEIMELIMLELLLMSSAILTIKEMFAQHN